MDQNKELLDETKLRSELEYLEGVSGEEGFWEDPTSARKTLTQLNRVKSAVDRLTKWSGWVEDVETAIELLQDEAAMSPEEGQAMKQEALDTMTRLNKDLDAWEMEKLLSGEYDNSGCRLTIQAGAGGTEAQDWAEMLQRMYIRYMERRGFRYLTTDEEPGEEAGIKSCTMEVYGDFAYGLLAGEKGTHRLVRQSPFNALNKRQTSFAGVETFPILEEQDLNSFVIPEGELEISTMRSGGAGGQNVNKVESGVRIKHTPTGLQVRCTQERSQLLNKARAMTMIKEKLLVIMKEQKANEIAEIRGDIVEASWGQQIRNYVFHPYKLVKDTRTGSETSQIQDVMDGDLDMFVESYLRYQTAIDAEAGTKT